MWVDRRGAGDGGRRMECWFVALDETKVDAGCANRGSALPSFQCGRQGEACMSGGWSVGLWRWTKRKWTRTGRGPHDIIDTKNGCGPDAGSGISAPYTRRLLPDLIHIVHAPGTRAPGGSFRGAKVGILWNFAKTRKNRPAGSKRSHAAGNLRKTAGTFATLSV
eukprot:gene23948-biopygen7356